MIGMSIHVSASSNSTSSLHAGFVEDREQPSAAIMSGMSTSNGLYVVVVVPPEDDDVFFALLVAMVMTAKPTINTNDPTLRQRLLNMEQGISRNDHATIIA